MLVYHHRERDGNSKGYKAKDKRGRGRSLTDGAVARRRCGGNGIKLEPVSNRSPAGTLAARSLHHLGLFDFHADNYTENPRLKSSAPIRSGR